MKLKIGLSFLILISVVTSSAAHENIAYQPADDQITIFIDKSQLTQALDSVIDTAATLLYDINHDRVAIESLHRQLVYTLQKHVGIMTNAFGQEVVVALSQLKTYTVVNQSFAQIAYNCRVLIHMAALCKLQLKSMKNLLVQTNELCSQKAIDYAQNVVTSLSFQSWYKLQKIKKSVYDHQLLLAGVVATVALLTTCSAGLFTNFFTSLLEKCTGHKEEQELKKDEQQIESTSVVLAPAAPPQPDNIIVPFAKKEDELNHAADQNATSTELVITEPKTEVVVLSAPENISLQNTSEDVQTHDIAAAQNKTEELKIVTSDQQKLDAMIVAPQPNVSAQTEKTELTSDAKNHDQLLQDQSVFQSQGESLLITPNEKDQLFQNK